jgi:TetR/AcrR family transcriptional repressor of nem operon
MQDTRETIMTLARATAQAHGYNGLSFRELAKAVGVKSASVHYHFPTKGDLGAALARRYREEAVAITRGLLGRKPRSHPLPALLYGSVPPRAGE